MRDFNFHMVVSNKVKKHGVKGWYQPWLMGRIFKKMIDPDVVRGCPITLGKQRRWKSHALWWTSSALVEYYDMGAAPQSMGVREE